MCVLSYLVGITMCSLKICQHVPLLLSIRGIFLDSSYEALSSRTPRIHFAAFPGHALAPGLVPLAGSWAGMDPCKLGVWRAK